MSESLSHDLREAWRQLRAKNPAMAALCLESAGALEKAEAELRRLREDVATLTDQRNEARELAREWSNEGGAEIARLQAREAKAWELAKLGYLALRSRLPMPNCQDCADENGFCPNNPGMPCDSKQAEEWAIEIRDRLSRWLAEGE